MPSVAASATPDRVGLIAGQGELVAAAARHLRVQGADVFAVGFDRITAETVSPEVDTYRTLKLGSLNKLIDFFQRHRVETVLMIGKIHKVRMFRDVRPDTRAIKLWAKLRDRRDDSILLALVNELEDEGIAVGRIDRYLRHLLAPKEKISRRGPDAREKADAALGWKIAKGIGRLDLGQTVVVKNRAPVAAEAIEGTDKTILRAGELAGKGTVVVKVAKPQQDYRFDVPVVGLETIKAMVASGASALAVEAGRTLFVQRDEALPLIRRHRIAFWGCRSSDFRESPAPAVE
jgi:DUF1009 family protein